MYTFCHLGKEVDSWLIVFRKVTPLYMKKFLNVGLSVLVFHVAMVFLFVMSECSPVIVLFQSRKFTILKIIKITILINSILFHVYIYSATSWHERSSFGIPCGVSPIKVLKYSVGSHVLMKRWLTSQSTQLVHYHSINGCQYLVLHGIFETPCSHVNRFPKFVVKTLSFNQALTCLANKSLRFIWRPLFYRSKVSVPIVLAWLQLPMKKSFKVSLNWPSCFLLIVFLPLGKPFRNLFKYKQRDNASTENNQ